jgi:serine O-acetyltransferase
MLFKIAKMITNDLGHSLLASVFRKAINKDAITKDAKRWIEPYDLEKRLPKNYTFYDLIFFLFNRYHEYRNLFYYRLSKDPAKNHFLFRLLKKIYPPRSSLKLLSYEIGPGFFIQHGTASGIGARKIGENCWINQHVSVGFSAKGKMPIIGNNVVIRPGAKIYGDITIGDNSTIAANAVVLKDVPPNCTVAGVPARIIRRNGQRVDEKL